MATVAIIWSAAISNRLAGSDLKIDIEFAFKFELSGWKFLLQ